MNQKVMIALPKGRLFETARALLADAGLRAKEEGSRKLVVGDVTGRYEFVSLKPGDIPVYVESGAIDAGIVGTDILRELESDVYEPVDLRIGLCSLVVAAPDGAVVRPEEMLRIATKYPRTAERHFRAKHAHVHIVRLDGSVEIAPLLGLSDAIVDLVETGRTLRENGMSIVEEVAKVSAKFIVNRTAMKMKGAEINFVIKELDRVVYENH
jgi:ATP phosphoribosyltransferase